MQCDEIAVKPVLISFLDKLFHLLATIAQRPCHTPLTKQRFGKSVASRSAVQHRKPKIRQIQRNGYIFHHRFHGCGKKVFQQPAQRIDQRLHFFFVEVIQFQVTERPLPSDGAIRILMEKRRIAVAFHRFVKLLSRFGECD
ncbi:MAG: hypothetical protein KatS3mg109_1184 [Pirellulaceae bacterium]|nr:MAG: hypothetical protein KatS3mg109_1184 [Pirellulaceae bacterium]